MKLPQIALPIHKTILPVSKKEVKYRPYTKKEENIILMGLQSESLQDALDATLQVMNIVVNDSINVIELHPEDFLWLYIKIRSASKGQMVEVDIDLNCESEECPKSISGEIDLENIKCSSGNLKKYKKKKDGVYIIDLKDGIGIGLKIKVLENLSSNNALYDSMFEFVFNGEEIYQKADVSIDEFEEWIETLPNDCVQKIHEFLANQPECYYNLEVKCPKCGKVYKEEVKGITNFLD